MYKTIINPLTNRKVKITSKLGQQLLQQYLQQNGGGNCSMCGAKGKTMRSCPCNPDSKSKNKHKIGPRGCPSAGAGGPAPKKPKKPK